MEKQVEQVKQVEQKMNEKRSKYTGGGAQPPGWLQAPAPYSGLGAAIAAELMIGFWFGIGAILAIKTVQSLDELISRK